MSELSSDPIWRRQQAAWKRRELWNGILSEAFRYSLPDHEAYRDTKAAGQDNHVQVLDSTAVDALNTRAARDLGSLFPIGEPWMDFDLSDPDLLEDETHGEEARQHRDESMTKFHMAMERSNFYLEIEPSLQEAHISVGCIGVHQGDAETPLYFESIPISQIAVEEARDGTLRSSFRQFSRRGGDILTEWPDARLGDDLRKKITDDPNKPVELRDALVWEEAERQWQFRLYAMGEAGDQPAGLLQSATYTTPPRICFRTRRAAGEWMGRGSVLAQLPNIKTANKTIELVLMAASIAVTGIWQADDDGVLNPANVKLVPGTIVPKAVGSDGLQPLSTGANFDVSQLVLNDMRATIRDAIRGPGLPDANLGDRRSTVEIAERVAEQAEVETPRTVRLQLELLVPLAVRVIGILTSPALNGSVYKIDPLTAGDRNDVLPVPNPPISRLREQQEAIRELQSVGMAMELAPEAVLQEVNMTKLVREALARLGVSPSSFYTEGEKQQNAEQQQQMAMAAMAAEAATKGQAA